MTHYVTIVAAILLTASAYTQQPKAKPGGASLQGTWVLTTINGQPAPDMTLTFEGNKYHQTFDGKVNERGTFKLDAAKKPMTIDLIITEGQDAGKTQLGVIEVTGDAVRGNFGQAGAPQRPPDFAIKETIMFTAKKKKP